MNTSTSSIKVTPEEFTPEEVFNVIYGAKYNPILPVEYIKEIINTKYNLEKRLDTIFNEEVKHIDDDVTCFMSINKEQFINGLALDGYYKIAVSYKFKFDNKEDLYRILIERILKYIKDKYGNSNRDTLGLWTVIVYVSDNGVPKFYNKKYNHILTPDDINKIMALKAKIKERSDFFVNDEIRHIDDEVAKYFTLNRDHLLNGLSTRDYHEIHIKCKNASTIYPDHHDRVVEYITNKYGMPNKHNQTYQEWAVLISLYDR